MIIRIITSSRSIEIDPHYAPATALAAWCHAQLVLYNGTPTPEQEQTRALLLSDRAGILDLDDPLVLTARCAVHTMSGQLDHAVVCLGLGTQRLGKCIYWRIESGH